MLPIRNRADSLFWNPSVENRIIGDIDNWISKSNFRRHNSWRKEAWLITLLKDLKMRRYFINFQVLGCVFCIVKPCILWALVSQNCLISQKWVENSRSSSFSNNEISVRRILHCIRVAVIILPLGGAGWRGYYS